MKDADPVHLVPAAAADRVGRDHQELDNNAVLAAAAVPLDDEYPQDGLDESDLEDVMNNHVDNEQLLSPSVDATAEHQAPGMANLWGLLQRSRAPQPPPQSPALQDPVLQQLANADVVVANIHRLTFSKLEALFPRDYFGVVIIDEAHHAAATTWATLLEYFATAYKVHVTATDFRGDRRELPMQIIEGSWDEGLKIKLRVTQGLCSNVAYAPVPVTSVTLSQQGHKMTYCGMQKIIELSERRDVQDAAMNNRAARQSVMRHSMHLMEHLRKLSGQKHTIIAQAFDITDAECLTKQWQALVAEDYGGRYTVKYTHSKLKKKQQIEIRDAVKSGNVDVIVQVAQLGEGFDAPCISVVAVFKVFRSMGPFMQLLGRAARKLKNLEPRHSANVAYLVAHPLLGYHKHWQLYCEERQDDWKELKGVGKANKCGEEEFQLASFQVDNQPDTLINGVQYLIPPTEIQPDDKAKSQKNMANASMVVHVTAGAASEPVVVTHMPATTAAGPSAGVRLRTSCQ